MAHRTSLLFLAGALLALLPLLWQVASPFLNSFILAAVLAIVTDPLKEWLSHRSRRPALAAFVTTLATVLVVGTIVVAAGVTITGELTAGYNALNQRSLEEGGWPALATHTADRVIDALAAYLPVNKAAIRAELIDRMRDASGYLLGNIGAAVGGLTTLLITGLLVTVFLYVLLRFGRQWVAVLCDLTPLDAPTTASLLRTVHDSVVANVVGVCAVVVGQALLLGVGFWFVGLRSPALWGTVGGLASIIPLIGAPLVWVPVVIAFVLNDAYGKALMLGLWGAFVVGSVDNLLRPLVVGARDRRHPILIALAAAGGTYAFGPFGIVLGPLLVSISAALWKEIRKLLAFPAVTAPSVENGQDTGGSPTQ